MAIIAVMGTAASCNIVSLIDVEAITLAMGSHKKTYEILDFVQKGGGGQPNFLSKKGMDVWFQYHLPTQAL